MKNSFENILESSLLFNENEKKTILSKFEKCRVEAKKEIVSYGATSNTLFYILQGCIRKYCLKNGEQITIQIATETQFAIEFVGFITGEAYFITDDEDLVFKKFLKNYVAAQVYSIPDKSISLGTARLFASLLEFIWKAFRLKNSPPLYHGLLNVLGLPFTVDISKAKKELKYRPVKTVRQGLLEMGQ